MKRRDALEKTPGVIFDLDGTLIDTLDDITDSLNQTFRDAGIAPVTRDRARALIGEGLSVLLQRASGESDSARIESLVRQYRAIYRERMFEKTRLYSGVADMLDRLTARDVPMCVLSNKPHEFTVPLCERLLSRWRFADVRGAVDPDTRKPNPVVALELCQRMSRRPNEVALVGDSDIDIMTAKNAGMRSVGVTWGFRDHDHLAEAAANVIVNTPAKVADRVLA